MSWSGKAADRSLILSILVFVCIGTCIYKAREYARAAPNERTTTAHVVSVYHSVFRGLRFNYYSCSYNFSVDGSLYVGLRDCPQWIIDDAIVYRVAVPWIGLGALIVFFFVFGKLLAANEKRGHGGVVVDARGTVIYPEEISVGSEFAGPFSYEAVNAASSPGLRELYLEVVNQIHPDRAANEADLALRERLMKEANAAFERGDTETLRRVLEEYRVTISAS